MLMATLLITGANGFVGSAVVRALSKHYRLRCLVRPGANFSYHHPHVEILEGALTDRAFLQHAVKGVTIIIHLAAVLDPRAPDLYAVNVRATRYLVDFAKRYHIRHFLLLSTENVLYSCTDPYTQSKREAESLVQQLPSYLILREPIIYGPGDERYIGRLIRMIQRWPFVPIPGDGTWQFQPIFIDDLVTYIKQGVTRRITGTYLLAGGEALSFNSLVYTLLHHLHLRKPLIHIPLPFLRFVSWILELLRIPSPLSRAQLANLSVHRTYSLDKQIHDFRHKPLSIREGLKRTLQSKSL